MRLRNIPGAEETIENSQYVINNPEYYKGTWNEVFKNSNPIFIEIGMGKGQFITTLARENPQINYLGIEKYPSVMLRAIQKIQDEDIPNLFFILTDAKLLPDVFGIEEIDKIYLNFSDPWPKERHAKRRLPSKEFLSRYDKFLKGKGTIEFKTDNKGLFNFAVEQMEEAHWKINKITYDLHNDQEMVQGNVMTEYEAKFSAIGNPIHKYIIWR
ncbi:MAG TPA: tRNA (guanosine(46)-N7)-methyltransferase TrmB [Lachnospiraceae bacterium]|nr:tRNA (guanosine(46)-N7)-methyltransferase TrmB [Lachnospiraceae bacterium]